MLLISQSATVLANDKTRKTQTGARSGSGTLGSPRIGVPPATGSTGSEKSEGALFAEVRLSIVPVDREIKTEIPA